MMPRMIFLLLLSEICPVSAADSTLRITQESGIITTEVGQDVILKCFCRDSAVTFLSWYQQSLGGKPLIISTRMKHNPEASISPAYKDRFQVSIQDEDGANHLMISNVSLSDSAAYYCGVLEFNAIEFGQGAFLHVKTSSSNVQAVVLQPALETLRSGDSVTLSCAVYAEKCAGEQSFYWFRHSAGQPAVMYPSAGQCTSDSESQQKNCSLNLDIKSVNSSDVGMYYCALETCGEIVFGNGTRVEITGGSTKVPSLLVYYLSVALAVSIILLLVLAFTMYKLKKKICSVCKGTVSHLTCSAASDTMSQDADGLHYAALSLKKTSTRQHPEESVDNMCVYSRVKNIKK